MKEKVFLFLNNLLSGKMCYIGLAISLFGIVVVFITTLILCAKKTEKQVKDYVILLFYLPFCAINLVFFNENMLKIFVLTLSISTLFFAITSATWQKKNYNKKSQNAVPKPQPKNLNLEVKNQDFRVEKLEKNPPPNDEKSKSITDFSHVKNVIERLYSFPLTQGDRKQIKELEDAIILIENGLEEEYSIGEELGALLKIMAKYGV